MTPHTLRMLLNCFLNSIPLTLQQSERSGHSRGYTSTNSWFCFGVKWAVRWTQHTEGPALVASEHRQSAFREHPEMEAIFWPARVAPNSFYFASLIPELICTQSHNTLQQLSRQMTRCERKHRFAHFRSAAWWFHWVPLSFYLLQNNYSDSTLHCSISLPKEAPLNLSSLSI